MKTRILLMIALVLLTCYVSAQENKASVALTKAIYEEEVRGNLDKAVELCLDILKKYPDDRPVAAKALYHLGLINEKMGKQKATEYFSRLVNTYPDQIEMVALAKERLAVLYSPGPRTLTARRLENPPADISMYGAISPDGRYLSFWDWGTDNIALRDLRTGKERPLIIEETQGNEEPNVSQSAGASVWSADSKQIANVWYISDSVSEHTELRIVGLEGGKPRVITQLTEARQMWSLSWSPDGKHIAGLVSQRNEPDQIVLVSTTNGSIRVLSELRRQIFPTTLRFTSDSRHIIYDRLRDHMNPERDIYVMNIDTGQETPLVQHPADDYLLGCSMDGQWLIFASDRTGNLGLWVVSLSGTEIQGEPRLIKPGIERILPVGLTDEGALYYGVVRATEDVFVVDLDPATGIVSGPPRKLVESYEGGNFTPSFSPDGKYLAYVSRRGNSPYPTNVGNALCIRSLDTGKEQVFYREIWRLGLRHIGGPKWSSDGSYIIFHGVTDISGSGEYRIDLKTGEISRIYVCGPDERLSDGACGPDGKFFSARVNTGTGISEIVIRDLQSGEEKELFRYPRVERGIRIALSPDAHWLCFSNAGWGGIRTLNIMPASGGEVKEIWSFGEIQRGTPGIHQAWSPDGRYILFSAPDTSDMRVWDL
ncbi:MAG: PD40 domain-containing protein, partial [Bacteroidales bacterium]|nr:PD40 domain-containing protein [Bacteroidales bacterium]